VTYWVRPYFAAPVHAVQLSSSVLGQLCPQFVRIVNGGSGDHHATFAAAFSAWRIQRRLA
jgi:hypothetical protein